MPVIFVDGVNVSIYVIASLFSYSLLSSILLYICGASVCKSGLFVHIKHTHLVLFLASMEAAIEPQVGAAR